MPEGRLPVAIGVAHCVKERDVGVAISGSERRVSGKQHAGLQAGVLIGRVDSTDY